jgi:hypothetical protein
VIDTPLYIAAMVDTGIVPYGLEVDVDVDEIRDGSGELVRRIISITEPQTITAEEAYRKLCLHLDNCGHSTKS